MSSLSGGQHTPGHSHFRIRLGGSPHCGHHSSMESLVPALSALTGSAFGSWAQEHIPSGPAASAPLEATWASGTLAVGQTHVHLRPTQAFLRLVPSCLRSGNQEHPHPPGEREAVLPGAQSPAFSWRAQSSWGHSCSCETTGMKLRFDLAPFSCTIYSSYLRPRCIFKSCVWSRVLPAVVWRLEGWPGYELFSETLILWLIQVS